MAFRGYFELDGNEFANSSRVVDHLDRGTPQSDGGYAKMVEMPLGSGLFMPEGSVEAPPGSGLFQIPPGVTEDPNNPGLFLFTKDSLSSGFDNCQINVDYDDSWPGLRRYLNGEDTEGVYEITEAPWYSDTIPESVDFAGVWIMDVDGLDSIVVDREVTEMIGNGGAAGQNRDSVRPIVFSAIIVAASNAGAQYGISWLSSKLRTATRRGGADLVFFNAHPSHSTADPSALLRRAHRVVLTEAPKVTATSGHGGGDRNRQASIYRITFELTALDPYIYSVNPDLYSVEWNTTTAESINWMHAPNCSDTSSCDLPVMFNADCYPEVVLVPPAPIPSCGGCVPVCAVTTSTWAKPALITRTSESAFTVVVVNTGDEPADASFHWRPTGSGDVCARRNEFKVNGLPAGCTAIFDSVKGRGEIIDNDGRLRRQVGILTTPSGAPWRPMINNTAESLELVAEYGEDESFAVYIATYTREG